MMKTLILITLTLAICIGCSNANNDAWKRMDTILSRIHAPQFPDRDFPVTAFGAAEGADCSEAFRRAIDSCAGAGGGRVVVPKGEYLAGPIRLRSNVDLHLSDGATIRFHTEPEAYLPPVLTKWEGVECLNYSPLIYAFGETNIAITGSGTLDGQASKERWWPWKGNKESGWTEGSPDQLEGRKKLFSMGENNTPVDQRVFGAGYYLRPSFIQPYRCSNILIDSVLIVNSPMWEIHPVLSRNITVRNVRIDSHGPNNDGCDPESCTDVLIEDCSFDTGDDCIAIKSGRNNDGRRLGAPSENIVIRRCAFKDGHGGITIGSEMSGGVRNVYAEDCRLESPVLYSALRIKSNAIRGGVVENVFLRNISVGFVDRAVIDVDLFYEEGHAGDHLPSIRTISIEGMTVDKCNIPLNLVGYPEAPLTDIRLKDCAFKQASSGYRIEHVENLELVNTSVNGKPMVRP